MSYLFLRSNDYIFTCVFLIMQVFISDVLGRVATTRLTSQVEIAVDNPTAVEAEVEGGAAGLQGFMII